MPGLSADSRRKTHSVVPFALTAVFLRSLPRLERSAASRVQRDPISANRQHSAGAFAISDYPRRVSSATSASGAGFYDSGVSAQQAYPCLTAPPLPWPIWRGLLPVGVSSLGREVLLKGMSSEKHFSPPERQEYFFDIQPPSPSSHISSAAA